jgi:flagellar hook-associated protein 3 FlgL
MSTRITTSMVQRNVLADLNAVSERLTRAQMKAASGKEISRPSDDPFNASRAMALRQDVTATEQHQRNVQDAQGWQEASEQAMTSITDALLRARDLVVQGASDSADQTARDAIAGPTSSAAPRPAHRPTSPAPTTPTRATRRGWTRPCPASSARSGPACR